MVVQISVEDAINSGLTGTQYILLEMLRVRNNKLIRKYIDFDPTAKKDLQRLKELGFILKMDSTGYLINHKLCSSILDLEDNLFWEVFSTYPLKVYNGNVTRILRSSSPDAKEALACLKKYKSKVKTLVKHRHVMKCLQAELTMRKKEKNLGYMKKLVTWLNQNAWEEYESIATEAGNSNIINTEVHGGKLI